MDELEKLRKEVDESLVEYVKLNDEFKARDIKFNEIDEIDKNIKTGKLKIEEIDEIDKMAKKVEEARDKWISKLRKYTEQRSKI